MSESFVAACVQLTSGPDPAESCDQAGQLIRRAAKQGAQLIMTPEVTDMIETRRTLAFEKAEPEQAHAGLHSLRALAGELGIWLLVGSLVVKLEAERLANRSFLIDPQGALVARYDKIHMFDVEIPDGQTYRESRAYRPGDSAVMAQLPWGVLGMTICYDLRFPPLYRTLAKAGADFLSVPSAFTRVDRRRPLARPAARPGDRDRLLRLRAGPVRRARRRPPDLWPFADRRALGRSAGRRR